jgi:ribosomal protein L30/L7E
MTTDFDAAALIALRQAPCPTGTADIAYRLTASFGRRPPAAKVLKALRRLAKTGHAVLVKTGNPSTWRATPAPWLAPSDPIETREAASQ